MNLPQKVLESLTNIAIIVVCVLLIGLFIARRDFWLHGKTQTTAELGLTGKVLSSLPEYNWASHNKTLVLGLRQGCRFCEGSIPFYKHLSELQQSKSPNAYSLACMPDEKAVSLQQLRSGGVNIEGYPGGRFRRFISL